MSKWQCPERNSGFVDGEMRIVHPRDIKCKESESRRKKLQNASLKERVLINRQNNILYSS